MPAYEFWYEENNTYKAWFTADTLEHAKALMDQVQEGEISLDDLPDFENKSKAYELLIDTIEEI